MSIGHAIQKGSLIYIYDQHGKQITSVSAPGRWPEDGLKHHTSTTISVQKGSPIYRYDESGRMVGRPLPAQPVMLGHQGQQLLSA